MATVYANCEDMLIACEVGVIDKYFRKWLEYREVVPRVAVSVLRRELDEFQATMEHYYDQEAIKGNLLSLEFIHSAISNMLLASLSNGLPIYVDIVNKVIEDYDNSRIMLNKLYRELDEYVVAMYLETIEDIDKGAMW